jgi:HicA toxin of bacterial toxin-antitoxin,
MSNVSGAEVVRVFERLGWSVVRRKGSRVITTKEGTRDAHCGRSSHGCEGRIAQPHSVRRVTVEDFVTAIK